MDRLEPKIVLELRPEEVVVLDVDPDLDLVEKLLAVNPSISEPEQYQPRLGVELPIIFPMVILHLLDPWKILASLNQSMK